MTSKLHLSIALLGLAALPAQAAPIAWGPATTLTGFTDVSTTGTLVEAVSGSTTTAYTVNSVVFAAGQILDSTTNNDNISTRVPAFPASVPAAENTNYASLLRAVSRNNTANNQPITFSGLTVGNTYQIQIWATDNTTTFANSGLVLGNGVGTTVNPATSGHRTLLIEATNGGYGQYALGTFTADATTQTLYVRTWGSLLTTPVVNTGASVNAIQIRDLGSDASAPTPNPMTWASVPAAVNESTITMTATTATDQSGVEYYFNETSGNPGGTDSAWQDSPVYTDTGLSDNTQYTYTVTARDKSPSQFTTTASSAASATTPALDNTPPSPNPMTWASVPAAVGYAAITMTATTATDPSGVEYFFDETTGNPGGTDSGWQDSPVYTDSGLDPNTTYSYTVTARDKSGAQNASAPSSPAAPATTSLKGTATITWSASDITNNVANVSTDGTLVSARNGATSSRTVNGVTFESIANSGNLFDSLYANDSIGARGYGSVVTNADYQGFLSLGQRSGRLGFNVSPQTEPTQIWATVEFSGLTIGNTYQVQLWASDVSLAASLDGLAQTKALVLGNGSASGPSELTDTFLYYEMTDGGAGQYGIGTFVANAPNQAFNVRTRQSLNTAPAWVNSDHFSNGWQLRDLGTSGPDIAAPTPNPMTWASVPDAVSASAITMTATTATDPSGVEYQFTRYAADGTTLLFTSPWQDSTTYVDTGLSSNTTYTYTVTARDKATIPNAGNPSTPKASATTDPVVVVGPVSAGNSTVAASPNSILANGIATSTITVTLKDSNGLLISGEGVTLAGSPAGATITPAGAQTSNASGQAAFTVKSSTISTVTFTATSVTNSTVITQAANVGFVDPATATAYNVNFLDEGQANVTGLVGVVGNPGETWNQGTGYSSGAINNLVSTTGSASTVSVSGLGDDGRTFATAGLSVFNGSRGFFGKGQNTTISITGLTPNTPFDLYIYSLGSSGSWGDATNTERAAGDFVTTNTVNGNGQSQWLDNGKAGTNDAVFLINGNYVFFQSIVANGSGSISIVVDAYDGIDGISGTGDGDCRLQVNALQIRPASGMSVDYAAWRSASYPGIGLPDADDDGDGLSNGYEHIFGLNPTASASASPYPTPITPASGYFSYSRRTQSMINMNYKVWYSTNLVNWFVDNAASQTPVSTSNNVEIMGVDINPALLAEPKLFMQVRATPITQLDVEPSLINLWGSGNTITLLFSEPMNPASAANPENYTVTQDGVGAINVTGATLNPGGGSVTLTLASTLGLKTGYTVNLDRVTSSTGQSLGSGVSRQFKTWDNDPNGIKVFILAGQSNMVGYGSVETGAGSVAGAIGSLRHMAVNDASFPEYNYASLLTNPSDTASAFRTRSDVKVWWRDPGSTGSLGGPILKGDLGPPYQGKQPTLIGPEFAFGQILGDYYTGANQDVLLIKCAWGGRDLAEKFRPPSAVAQRGGVVGPFYNAIIEQTREVLHNLGTQFPAWSGRGYEIVGFAWHQGYNDRLSTVQSNEYKYNLPNLISDVRNVFNKPNMPFVIASTGMATGGAAEASPYPSYTAVEKAQLWVSEIPVPSVPPAPAQPANVLSTDTRPFWRDKAVSPADQSHHWNWSAESYFLIGKSLGDNMVDLLTP